MTACVCTREGALACVCQAPELGDPGNGASSSVCLFPPGAKHGSCSDVRAGKIDDDCVLSTRPHEWPLLEGCTGLVACAASA